MHPQSVSRGCTYGCLSSPASNGLPGWAAQPVRGEESPAPRPRRPQPVCPAPFSVPRPWPLQALSEVLHTLEPNFLSTSPPLGLSRATSRLPALSLCSE